MQKPNSLSVAFSGFFVLLRALSVFFGGTFVVHWLARTAAPSLRVQESAQTDVAPYFVWLGDAIQLNSSTTSALGNSMFLGAAGVLIGLVLGTAFGGLVRIPKVGRAFGLLALPSLAIFVPGILLFPLAKTALDQDWIPVQALTDGQPFSESLSFIGFWGSLVGLALLPSVAAVTAGTKRTRLLGLSTIEAANAARTEPSSRWRFGLPTAVFGLAMASAELLSGLDGVFGRLAGALQSGDLVTALDLTIVVVIAATVAAIAIDLVGLRVSDDQQQAETLAPVSTSRLSFPLFVGLVLGAGLAGAGFAIDASVRQTPTRVLADPTFGGPWLGTDAVGRSLLARIAEALGPALLAALVPGLVAVVLGLLVAALRRAAPTFIDRFVGAIIDALSWPLPIVVPFIAVFSQRQLIAAEFQIEVLALSGLALTPLASRLITRSVLPASTGRAFRWAAAGLYCSSLAFAAYLVTGFMGLYNNDAASLGELIAEGVTIYGDAVWPLLAPSIAAVALLGLLYGLATAIALPDYAAVRAADSSDDGDPADRTSVLEGVAADRDDKTIDLNTEPDTEVLDQDFWGSGSQDRGGFKPGELDEPSADESDEIGERILADAGAKTDLLPASASGLFETSEATEAENNWFEADETNDDSRAIGGVFADRPGGPVARSESNGPADEDGSISDSPADGSPADSEDESSIDDSDNDAPQADDHQADDSAPRRSVLEQDEAQLNSGSAPQPIAGPPPMPSPIAGPPPIPNQAPNVAAAMTTADAGGDHPPMPDASFSLAARQSGMPADGDGRVDTDEHSTDAEPVIDIDALEDESAGEDAAAKANELMDAAASDDGDGLFDASKTIELRPSTVREAQAQAHGATAGLSENAGSDADIVLDDRQFEDFEDGDEAKPILASPGHLSDVDQDDA